MTICLVFNWQNIGYSADKWIFLDECPTQNPTPVPVTTKPTGDLTLPGVAASAINIQCAGEYNIRTGYPGSHISTDSLIQWNHIAQSIAGVTCSFGPHCDILKTQKPFQDLYGQWGRTQESFGHSKVMLPSQLFCTGRITDSTFSRQSV